MSSMDKRRGAHLGRPKRTHAIHVVLAKDLTSGDVSVEKVYTNGDKAEVYIHGFLLSSDNVRRWAERWAVE